MPPTSLQTMGTVRTVLELCEARGFGGIKLIKEVHSRLPAPLQAQLSTNAPLSARDEEGAVRRMYRALARQVHPDALAKRGGSVGVDEAAAAAAAFKAITAAQDAALEHIRERAEESARAAMSVREYEDVDGDGDEDGSKPWKVGARTAKMKWGSASSSRGAGACAEFQRARREANTVAQGKENGDTWGDIGDEPCRRKSSSAFDADISILAGGEGTGAAPAVCAREDVFDFNSSAMKRSHASEDGNIANPITAIDSSSPSCSYSTDDSGSSDGGHESDGLNGANGAHRERWIGVDGRGEGSLSDGGQTAPPDCARTSNHRARNVWKAPAKSSSRANYIGGRGDAIAASKTRADAEAKRKPCRRRRFRRKAKKSRKAEEEEFEDILRGGVDSAEDCAPGPEGALTARVEDGSNVKSKRRRRQPVQPTSREDIESARAAIHRATRQGTMGMFFDR